MKAEVRLSNAETLAVLRRAMRFVREMPGRFAVKVIVAAISLTPVWLLPYPAKLVVDHVIFKAPLSEGKYPWFLQPFVRALIGASPAQIVLAVAVFAAVSLLLFGGWSTLDQQRLSAVAMIGQNSTGLAEGNDIASRAQNVASAGSSWCGGLIGWFEYQWNVRLSQEINHRLRSRLFQRIQRLPMVQLDDQRIGDAIYRLMYDSASVSEICNRLAFTPPLALLNMAILTYLMILQFPGRWTFLLVGLLVIPVSMLITLPLSGTLRRTTARARAAGAATTSTLEESVSNVLAVQALGAQGREREHFAADSWRSYGQSRLRFIIEASVVWVAVVVGTFGMGTFIYFDVTNALFAKQITVGDVGVLMSFYGMIIFNARELGSLWYVLQDAAVGAKRAFDLLDAPIDPQPAAAQPLSTVREGYRFENVSFAYPDGTLALSGIDLEARRGTMVALVGPAGAGKTSLAYMLPRFLSPTSGRILVDGQDLSAVDREALRNQIAFVFQEPVLFDATVAENIRIGKPDATDAEVQRAAEIAGASEFIARMPQQYATRLGRGGGRLSVGQKQRLSIARALVRGAPVLVLDEPTAALDPETELRLVAALQEASRDRLVMVIAHRLSTIRHADQIVFLEEGKIRERGSHAQLMANPAGAYRQFVELQAGT